jgi:DNA ligase-4
MILSNEFVPSFSSDHSLTSQRLLGLSWTYYLPRSMSPPSVLFQKPLCAEIMGAGFQKLPFSQYYELRWPRLQKIFPPDERIWTEGMPPSKYITDE